MSLDQRSIDRLAKVHPDLVRVILKAAEGDCDFVVTEGKRSIERQRDLFLDHKSQTMHSRHLNGCAVDLAVWQDKDEDRVLDVDELSWKFPA